MHKDAEKEEEARGCMKKQKTHKDAERKKKEEDLLILPRQKKIRRK